MQAFSVKENLVMFVSFIIERQVLLNHPPKNIHDFQFTFCCQIELTAS
jgi:hypothetical protein